MAGAGGYDRRCQQIDPKEAAARHAAGEQSVVRLRVPAGETMLQDQVAAARNVTGPQVVAFRCMAL